MKVLVTGGTGLIGSALGTALENRGDEVLVASRSETGEGYVRWDPRDPESLSLPPGTDAVVHLAGAPVFGRRWTSDYKEEIRRSRVEGTRTVVRAIRAYSGDLKAFVSTSAVGYYGDRGDQKLSEDAGAGEDFLARVCQQWEEEVREFAGRSDDESPAVSIARTGVVLSREGGALKRMLNPFPGIYPFHMGLGGPLGSGRQYMPWIHVEDEVRAILFLIDEELHGTYNLSAPNPVTNKKFTRALGSVLGRPAFLPVPYVALRILYGEAASILYASQRVVPGALEEAGFEFEYRTVEPALRNLLGRN